MSKKVLKEWFPNKEEVIELENFQEEEQGPIYPDAADEGIIWTPQVHEKIKRLLTILKNTYGGKADDPWGNKKSGGVSYNIFVPTEHSDLPGKYGGTLIRVSLHKDPALIGRYGYKSDKFYSIQFIDTRLSPQEAKSKYNSKFFDGNDKSTLEENYKKRRAKEEVLYLIRRTNEVNKKVIKDMAKKGLKIKL